MSNWSLKITSRAFVCLQGGCHTRQLTSISMSLPEAEAVKGQISVKLPDGSVHELTTGATAADLAAGIGKRLAQAAIVAEVNGIQVDLDRPLPDGATVRIITEDSEEGRFVIRHSTAHVMA